MLSEADVNRIREELEFEGYSVRSLELDNYGFHSEPSADTFRKLRAISGEAILQLNPQDRGNATRTVQPGAVEPIYPGQKFTVQSINPEEGWMGFLATSPEVS